MNDEQMYYNLLTQTPYILTEKEKLSTSEKKTFQINKKEVRQRILGFINTFRGKKELYFWTVTFPPAVKDEMAYRVFNIWLTSLRQRGMLKNYLWIAERQPDTGTIHFHIAIPHKMPVQRANAMMRGTLKNLVRKGELNYSIHKIARYNGVDIAKNRHTRRVTNFAIKKGSRALVTYLTKYITKNDGSFQRAAWGNSRGYSSLFTGVTFTITEFKKFSPFLDKAKKFESEFFTFVPWTDAGPPLQLITHLYNLNSFLQWQLN